MEKQFVDAEETASMAAPRAEASLQMRLQILSTEHWSLLASRSLAWTESFSRASMFLSTLSFAVVSLALVGQASDFGSDFRIFSLIVLPVVLLVGIATSLRMDNANQHDMQCVIGMNRIRAGYLEIAPELDRYFVMGFSDDFPGIVKTMALVPNRPAWTNFLSASPVLIAILNAVLAGGIVAIGFIEGGLAQTPAFLAAVATFVLSSLIWVFFAVQTLRSVSSTYRPLFPSPNGMEKDEG